MDQPGGFAFVPLRAVFSDGVRWVAELASEVVENFICVPHSAQRVDAPVDNSFDRLPGLGDRARQLRGFNPVFAK